jgi:hypothetical protein
MWHSATRDLAVVLGASWLARILFVAAVGDAHSLDVEYWQGALSAQDEGKNPYETGVLNWPPLWFEVIVGLDALADRLDVSFLSVLRVYLILVESAIVVTLYLTLVSIGAARRAVRRALLVGIAVNPVMVILVCQHGNSDVNVGLFVTLACSALIAYQRSRDVVLWLVGCLMLGLGVLAKTTPLILAPLLAPGARLTSNTGRALGVALLVTPVWAGLSVLLALVPRATLDHVIAYKTRPGNFGIAGVIQQVTITTPAYVHAVVLVLSAAALALWAWSRRDRSRRPTRRYLLALTLGMLVALLAVEALAAISIDARSRYGTFLTVALVGLVVWLGHRLWREPPLDAELLFLLVAVIFMSVVAFGTGYAAHYAPWFLPALIATYVLLDDAWRKLLLAAYVISAVTYAVEYAFIDFLGAYAAPALGEPGWVSDMGEWLNHPDRWGAMRIPLFVTYLVVIAAGAARISELMKRSSGGSDARTSPPEASRAASALPRS